MPEQVLIQPPAGFQCKAVGRDITLSEAWEKISKFDEIYLDSESNFLKWWNFKPDDIAGYSISTKDNENYYFPIHMKKYFPQQANLDPVLCARFLNELKRRRKRFIYGNAKIDWHIIGPTLGVDLSDTEFRDILLLSHLVDPNGLHGVKTIGERIVVGARFAEYMLKEIKKSFGMTKKAGTDFDYRLVPLEVMVYYACCDTWLTRLIDEWLQLNPHLSAFKDYIEVEHEVCRGLYHTENRGIRIDQTYIEEKRVEYEDVIIEDRAYIWYHAGERFNPESNPQMLDVLYDHLTLPKQYAEDIRTHQIHLAANKQALLALQHMHPIVPAIQKWRKDKKIKEYIDKIANNLDDNGRIHTNFNQFKENTADLRTGRLSSSDPINFENIPRADTTVRRAFIPDEYFFFADWNNQEGRLYAHYANEQVYKDAFLRGEDSHARTCSFAFPELTYEYIVAHKKEPEVDKFRQISKRSFFRKLYGGGYKKGAIVLAEYGEPYDEERSRQIDNNILKGLPNFNRFCKKVIERAQERGYVYDVFNRRYVPKLNTRTNEYIYYALPNYLIQGSAGGMLKIAMVRIMKIYGYDIFSNFIHDEVAYDRLPNRACTKELHEIMTTWPEISVPMQVECSWVPQGKTWADKTEISNLEDWMKEDAPTLAA